MKFWGYPRPETEFWSDAIAAVKTKYPNVQFLAEVLLLLLLPLSHLGLYFLSHSPSPFSLEGSTSLKC